MNRHLCIGSQLFVNDTETTEQLRALVQKMKDAGLSLIRLFLSRDLLEAQKDAWDFSLFDAIFDEAEALQMGVVPTLMAVTAPGRMHVTTSSQDLYDLDDPALFASGLSYVDRVVQHYAKHPALHSWILWNEPSRTIPLQSANIAMYTDFLRHKYNTIAVYNACHYRKFESFEDLQAHFLDVRPSLVFQPYADKTDLLDFTVQNLCEKLKDIKAHVRLWDSSHPVHVNPHDIAGENYTNGQNFFEEGKCVDFLGCSAHPSWHSTDFPKSRIPLSIAFFADVMRAASADRERFWITELQGGTNIFSGKDYLCPDEKDIGLYLAAGFGTGAEAAVFWCFNTRNAGFEGGEWGLLNQLGERSERLCAVANFAQLISKHQSLFDASKPADPDVYILYSDNTIRLQMLETVFRTADGIRNKNNGKFSLIGAYEAVTDLGLHPGFISEEQVRAGLLPSGGTLILPDTYCLSPDTLTSISDFVFGGGTVVADGLIGMKTPDGALCDKTLEQASMLFGAKVRDLIATDAPISIRNDDATCHSEFLKVQFDLTDGVLSADTLHHAFGSGRAIRIPAVLFRHYFRTEDTDILTFLRPLMPKNRKLHLSNPSAMLTMKTLESETKNIHILYNTDASPIVAELSEDTVIHMLTSHTVSAQNGKTSISLDGRDYAVFTTEK